MRKLVIFLTLITAIIGITACSKDHDEVGNITDYEREMFIGNWYDDEDHYWTFNADGTCIDLYDRFAKTGLWEYESQSQILSVIMNNTIYQRSWHIISFEKDKWIGARLTSHSSLIDIFTRSKQ